MRAAPLPRKPHGLMPPVRDEYLLLPSPLGLLEYDILEDAVFLGPAPRGGIEARATPFPAAQVALTREGGRFVVRALPGSSGVEHNGAPPGGEPLADGDRVRVGDQVAMFRSARAPAPPPAAPARPEPGPRRAPGPARARRDPWQVGGALAGAALLLVAIAQAVGHLKELQRAHDAVRAIPPAERTRAAEPARLERELDELLGWADQNPERPAEAAARLREFGLKHLGDPAGEVALARARELAHRAAAAAWVALGARVDELLAGGRYAAALKELRVFEAEHGALPEAAEAAALRQRVRTEARAALDALVREVGPLIQRQPREAHRRLLTAAGEFPADLAAEVTTLIERAVERMLALSRAAPAPRDSGPGPGPGPRPPAPGPTGPEDLPPAEAPAGPEPGPGAGPPGDPPPPRAEAAAAEARARDAWLAAYADLAAGRHADALHAYTLLLQQHGDTELFRRHRRAIQAGRRAARVGVEGPAALLHAPATVKRGRLEVAYEFEQPEELEADFTLEQPFSSELPFEGNWERGAVRLRHATGLLHRVVFEPDVRIEARVLVQAPNDLGLLAVADTTAYRALVLTLANTRFRLKKGAEARVNPGHVLWFIGEGVWRDADADAHGFIKVAERGTSKLEGGDRITMELERRQERARAGFEGRTDGVTLEGRVRGDDGSGLGSARVGVFTHGTSLVVEAVRISGVVDAAWFARELALLVRAARPDESR